MLPEKLSSRESEALSEILSSPNYSVFINLLVKLVEEQERAILNLTASDCESLQKLTLVKGQQLCAKEIKASLTQFKTYCRKHYKI